MSYFNTTNESGTTLKNNVAKAKSQEEKIFKLFQLDFEYWSKNKNPYIGLTPVDLLDFFPKYPITSIRRSLTNLTKQGKLIKTDEKRIGMYGRSEYVLKLNENN
jgi:hypothetical protein